MMAKHGIVLNPDALKIAADCMWDEFCPGIRKTDDDEAFYLARAEAVISSYIAAGELPDAAKLAAELKCVALVCENQGWPASARKAREAASALTTLSGEVERMREALGQLERRCDFLTAAAPSLRAQGMRDAIQELDDVEDGTSYPPRLWARRRAVLAKAAELEQGK